jgi:hypothetical protein
MRNEVYLSKIAVYNEATFHVGPGVITKLSLTLHSMNI